MVLQKLVVKLKCVYFLTKRLYFVVRNNGLRVFSYTIYYIYEGV
jgi:hypothetical protein